LKLCNHSIYFYCTYEPLAKLGMFSFIRKMHSCALCCAVGTVLAV